MRGFDRDLIRGGHYGQRSCEPHKQAEHMAAPTSLRREESPCQPGAVHTWHIAAPDVCDGTSAGGESRHRIPGASVGRAATGHKTLPTGVTPRDGSVPTDAAASVSYMTSV